MTVEIQHVYKTFRSTEVLHDISFKINEGEVVGLLGPNGAGKTTLMRIMSGIFQPDDRKNVTTTLNLPLTKGYLSEKNPLYDYMYVREYLDFMARFIPHLNKTQRAEKIEKLIDDVGLTGEANKKIKELSKGYRQRVGLAQAIMDDPQLLILDEPTTGLDPNQLTDIRQLIHNLSDNRLFQPKVIILSTHILQEVQAMCSRVIIIDKGHIKTDKPIDEIDDLETLFKTVTHPSHGNG